ncbi:MAG: DUF58 domain-containing protein [Planctomycetota bacterium]|nr:DUF58 domain-containing protein [Planctomycetota bacterium]
MKKRRLFGEGFVRRLDALALLVHKTLAGGRAHLRAAHSRGGSTEFVDHREYTPGDEFRYVDWNVYGRTGRLFVREFAGDESPVLHIIIDSSASMAFGAPPKFDLARQLAAAIAYVSMSEESEARLVLHSGSGSREIAGLRTKARVSELLRFLEDGAARGETSVGRALFELATTRSRQRMVVVISDLLEEGRLHENIAGLSEKGQEITLLHVASEGVGPAHAGEAARLVDSETGETMDVSLTESSLGRYYSELDEFSKRWQRFAQSHGAGYLHFPSSKSCEEVALECLHDGLIFRPAK